MLNDSNQQSVYQLFAGSLTGSYKHSLYTTLLYLRSYFPDCILFITTVDNCVDRSNLLVELSRGAAIN